MSFESLTSYGPEFIQKVLSVLLTRKNYTETVVESLDPFLFETPYDQWIVRKLQDYHDRYQSLPDRDYFRIEVRKLKDPKDDDQFYTGVVSRLRECYETTADDLDFVQAEFTDFSRTRMVEDAMRNVVGLIRGKQWDDAKRVLDQAFEVGAESIGGHDYNHDVEARYHRSAELTIPLPFPEYTARLPLGGLVPGNLALMLGPAGGGKTWWCINWANQLLDQGFDVLHFNLESEFRFIGQRYDANRMGIPMEDCPFNIGRIKDALATVPGRLHVKDLESSKERTLSYMYKYFSYCVRVLKMRPRFVIIDYIQRMVNESSQKDANKADAELLKKVIDFAKQTGTVVLSPVPVNREGKKSGQILTDTAIGGTYAAIYDADLILSWTPEQRAIHWIKNKNGPGGGSTELVTLDPAMGRFTLLGNWDADSQPVAEETRHKALKTLGPLLGRPQSNHL